MGAYQILAQILVALLVITLILLGLFKYSLFYWKRRRVIYVPNPRIPLGNLTKLIKKEETLPEFVTNTYNYIKANNAKHGGLYLFGRPVWMPVDLDLLDKVVIKDFPHFVNHGFYANAKDDPLSSHLFTLEDEEWRKLRAAFSPIFTAGKIKMMFSIMEQTGKNLEKIVQKTAMDRESVDVKDYFTRFTSDVVSSIFLGLQVNSIENPDDDLVNRVGSKFFNNKIQALRMLISFIIPKKYLVALRFRFVNPDICDFFMNIVRSTIDYREKNNIERKDLIQLLMQLKKSGSVMDTGETKHLTIEEIAAQLFLFYAAGFETSATTATFALLEMALNQDIQDKAREEVRRITKKYNGQLTYEACMEMNYLEQVIKETLRKYPPLSMVFRQCTKDYDVPGSDVVIEKGTMVMLPIIAVQNDPDIYPDPEKFDPNRFGPDNSTPNIAFLSFGEGPRICIGKRFGIIQTKIALASVIKNHRVTVNTGKTKIPVVIAPDLLITTAKEGVWLNMTKIE